MNIPISTNTQTAYCKNSLSRNTTTIVQHPYTKDNITAYNSHLKNLQRPNRIHANITASVSTPTPIQASNNTVPVVSPIQSNHNTIPVPTPIQPSNNTVPTPATMQLISKPIPALNKPIQKGQKANLLFHPEQDILNACFGWNVKNALCDIDVSAFLLGENGKVLGDDWFVFYGQTHSPDNSIVFHDNGVQDREFFSIDFKKLNGAVKKIVFVLTINEALQNNLNFGMLQDAYIRIMNKENELVSYQMTEYYSNVISMMIGELYLYKGNWKFNAIGNGVARDLEGLCEYYGVQVIH